MKLKILAKSSSNPEFPYDVIFRKKNGEITISCSCPAGSLGWLCKHKLELIQCNQRMLHNPNDKKSLDAISELLEGSAVLSIVNEYCQKVKDIEKRQNDLKEELKALKHQLARKMNQGINLL